MSRIKVILSCMIGNALEWYDFVIYGYFTTIIGKLFFPSLDPVVQLIDTLGIFWAGFLTRPIGAVLFGYIGDKISRKQALMWSIYTMAIPTALIGCLPTHDQIGWMAPALLALLRVFQGLAIGGEFTGAMIFMIEYAPARKHGLYGSWSAFSLVMGVILGSAIAMMFTLWLPPAHLESWGWRIPFILSIFISLVGTYMRKSLSDPKAYLRAKSKVQSAPFMDVLRHYKKPVAIVLLLDFLTAFGFFILVIFLANYFKTFLGLTYEASLAINTTNMLLFAAVIPLGGWLSDKYGRAPLLLYPCLGFILLSYPLFSLFQEGGYVLIFCIQAIFVIMMGIFFGTIPATLADLFPAHVRYTGLSVSHNLSMALFGGSAPVIATHLIQTTQDLASPAYLLIGAAALSIIPLVRIKKSMGRIRDEE